MKASDSALLISWSKYVISEEDAKQRIAELTEDRSRVEAAPAALGETPVAIALHPATLDR